MQKTESSEPFRPGMLIGNKFVLLRLIAEGGMSSVFEAKDELIQRHVAIKLLRPRDARDADTVRRFRREAELAASIQHPNVVSILEMGQRQDGSFYLVQELLRGDNLRTHLRQRGRFSVEEALEILLPVMGALVAAHSQGIIHRDLKPENIVLTRSPSGELVPKLIDFGVAKGYVADGAVDLTAVGSLVGTPKYMSPEQVKGMHPLDARTDVWSLGVVLYELLSGVLPHAEPGMPPPAVLLRIASDPPRSLRSAAADLPEGLVSIVHRAVEPERGRRLPSVMALRDEILAFTNRRSILLSPAQGPRSVRRAGDGGSVPPPASRGSPAPRNDPRAAAAARAALNERQLDPEQLAPANPRAPDAAANQTSPSSPSGRAWPTGVRAEVAWAEESAPAATTEQDRHAEAAERALEVNRLEEAIQSAERALAKGPAKGSVAGRMRLIQAIAHRWLGDYEACERCSFEAAAHLARGSGGWYAAQGHAAIAAGYLGRSETLLALSEELKQVEMAEDKVHFHAIALCRLATFLIRAGLPNLALQLYEDAQALLGDGEIAAALVRAWFEVARAEIAAHRGDRVAYLQRVEAAAEAFAAAGDMRNACLQRANVGNAYMHLGAYRLAAGVLRHALDVAEPMGLDFVAPVQVTLGFALAQLDQLDQALAVESAALRECLQKHNRRSAGRALIYVAAMHATRQELPRALELASEAVAMLEGHAPLRAYALAMLAWLLLARKQAADALARAQEATDLLRRLGGVEEGESLIRAVYALSLRAAGREPEARSEMSAARMRLLDRADRIQDAAWRQSFLEGVQDNARLMHLASQWLDGGGDPGAPRG